MPSIGTGEPWHNRRRDDGSNTHDSARGRSARTVHGRGPPGGFIFGHGSPDPIMEMLSDGASAPPKPFTDKDPPAASFSATDKTTTPPESFMATALGGAAPPKSVMDMPLDEAAAKDMRENPELLAEMNHLVRKKELAHRVAREIETTIDKTITEHPDVHPSVILGLLMQLRRVYTNVRDIHVQANNLMGKPVHEGDFDDGFRQLDDQIVSARRMVARAGSPPP